MKYTEYDDGSVGIMVRVSGTSSEKEEIFVDKDSLDIIEKYYDDIAILHHYDQKYVGFYSPPKSYPARLLPEILKKHGINMSKYYFADRNTLNLCVNNILAGRPKIGKQSVPIKWRTINNYITTETDFWELKLEKKDEDLVIGKKIYVEINSHSLQVWVISKNTEKIPMSKLLKQKYPELLGKMPNIHKKNGDPLDFRHENLTNHKVKVSADKSKIIDEYITNGRKRKLAGTSKIKTRSKPKANYYTCIECQQDLPEGSFPVHDGIMSYVCRACEDKKALSVLTTVDNKKILIEPKHHSVLSGKKWHHDENGAFFYERGKKRKYLQDILSPMFKMGFITSDVLNYRRDNIKILDEREESNSLEGEISTPGVKFQPA